MNVEQLRCAIKAARKHEAETGQLSQFLQGQIGELHHSIQLPVENSTAALLNFVIRYIEHVPEFIEAVGDIAKKAGIESSIEPVIQVACEFFLTPPEVVADKLEERHSLVALMDEAYLAHRLIEEVNDRYMAHLGAPLVPMDMTRSNLIVHHLIGEAFANQLDKAVAAAVNQLQCRDRGNLKLTSFVDRCRQRDMDRELIRWPCLTDSLSINLMLNRP